MRDTLVAKDLEQATRLAYGSGKRYRVVTLQGQLIEASGTMSGGGNKVAKGGMTSSLADALPEKQLRKMEADVEGLGEREFHAVVGVEQPAAAGRSGQSRLQPRGGWLLPSCPPQLR